MTTQGNRLKKIRKELRLSQEEFAKQIGLSRAAIAAVEADNNNFSQDVLCKLILTFDININYQSDTNFDMFSLNNENTIVNNTFIFSMIEKPEYTFNSLDISSSFINSKGNINAKALLYSDTKISLLEFTQELTNKDDTYFNVYLPFILKDNLIIDNSSI